MIKPKPAAKPARTLTAGQATRRSADQPAEQSEHSEQPTRVWPGLVLAGGATAIAYLASQVLPSIVSPLMIAIVLGVLLRNLIKLPALLEPGLAFAAKHVLRAGVVLLGLQLPLRQVIDLGPGLIGVVVVVVGLGVLVTTGLGRLLGIGLKQRLLIACGFSICGASAIAAADGVLDADDEEVVTAIALVVIFGTAMIPVVPLVGHALGLTTNQQGVWAGAAIHEVAQVVAAGGAVGGSALAVAVVVKLARVLMLAPVLAVLGVAHRRVTPVPTDQGDTGPGASDGTAGRRPPLVPLFVLGFVAMAALRSLDVVPAVALDLAGLGQGALLTGAMFALGCGVRVTRLRQVGPRPFLLAAGSTVFVSSLALGGAALFG